MAKKATLCFVKLKDEILMINRNKPPFMGMWNALGGKVLEGESLTDCAKREIFEDSGIRVTSVKLFSEFTWNYDDEIGYAFLAELNNDFDKANFPKEIDEGIVAFKSIDFITSEKNQGVIEDLKIFINDIKNGVSQDYHLIYDGKRLLEAVKKWLQKSYMAR